MFLGAGGSKGNVEETSKKLKNKEKTTKGKGTVPVQVCGSRVSSSTQEGKPNKKEKIRVLIECHW
jgi:hypothetical protein